MLFSLARKRPWHALFPVSGRRYDVSCLDTDADPASAFATMLHVLLNSGARMGLTDVQAGLLQGTRSWKHCDVTLVCQIRPYGGRTRVQLWARLESVLSWGTFDFAEQLLRQYQQEATDATLRPTH